MQADKKQLEILIMQYFRKSYSDFPKGRMKSTESPDFTLNMKNFRLLGIELTRLNPENAKALDEEGYRNIRFIEHCINFSKELFEQNSTLKLFIKFLFSDAKVISEERKVAVAVQIVNAIRKVVQNKKGHSFFKQSIPQSELPEGLEEILIVHHPKLEISVWERSNNLGISNNVIDDIRKTIHKKDEKLRLYQKQRLNYYWLLITTDRLRGVKSFNLPDKIMNHKFQSQFQHVFLFDLIKSAVIKLV